MQKHHTEDYKLSAVKYYLEYENTMRETCELFKFSYKSLYRWVNRYGQHKNIKEENNKETI